MMAADISPRPLAVKAAADCPTLKRREKLWVADAGSPVSQHDMTVTARIRGTVRASKAASMCVVVVCPIPA